jgi:hypothetical protein
MAWGVLDWNAPAFAFYHKLGAVRSDAPVQMELHAGALEALACEAASTKALARDV